MEKWLSLLDDCLAATGGVDGTKDCVAGSAATIFRETIPI